MSHPTTGELLELHFGEADPLRRDGLSTHVGGCAACRALGEDLEWTERVLATGPDDAPPADGLARVLARVEASRPARRRPSPRLRAALPCAAALLAGSAAVLQGGAAAALAFFAVGSLLTLSIAPVLILESQRRSR